MYLSLTLLLKLPIILQLSSFSLGNSDNYHNQNPPQPYYPEYAVDNISPPKPGWVNPFDMLGEGQSHGTLMVQSEVDMHILQKRCTNNEVYLRRFVNMFLKAVELRDERAFESSVNLVKLEFVINGEDLKTLKEFGTVKNGGPKIQSVSDIFTKIFSQKTPQDRNILFASDILRWIQKVFLKIISSPEWTIFSSISLLYILSLWFVYHTHSYRLALFTIFLTLFCAGFGFTWMRMYEEKDIERYANIEIHGAVPRHCTSQSQTMAWYEHVYFRMFGVDCDKFYKSRDIRPMVKISPTDVFAETVSSMIVNPATHLGKAYGNFISSFIGPLPFWLKIFALPLILIISVLFVIIILVFLFNYSFSASIMGIHLKPTLAHQCGGRKDNQYVEECPRKENTVLQNNTHIPFLENDTELFVMNWKGLKKLSSSTLLGEKNNQHKIKETEDSPNEDNRSLEKDDKEMMEELKQLEQLVGVMESQKNIEEHKKRSIHTFSEGGSSLTNRRNDPRKAPMIEFTDLPPDSNRTPPSDHGKEKEFKNKTT